MSLASIRSLAYRTNSSDPYTPIDFQNQSCELSCSSKQGKQGVRKTYELQFKIAAMNQKHEGLKHTLLNNRIQFEAIPYDSDTSFTIGSSALPPEIKFSDVIEKRAGGWNGYKVKVEWQSF